MPGSYFMWLGYMKKSELESAPPGERRKRNRHGVFELRLLGRLNNRKEHRNGALHRSILRTQVFRAYQTPGRRVLERLDDCIGKLLMEMDLCESFYSRDKVTAKIKDDLERSIRYLNRAYNSRFFKKEDILRYVLNQLLVSASGIRNQINENPYSDRFLEYLKKRIGYFLKAYQGTIGKDLVLAEEKAAETGVSPEILAEADKKSEYKSLSK